MAEAGGAGGRPGPGGEERLHPELSDGLSEADRERRLLGDILSHDLLNPVWVAENYVRFALEERDPEEGRRHLEGARAALAKTRAILLDARTYLRLPERGEVPRERLPAAALVEEAASPLRSRWEARGQHVALDVPAGTELRGSPLLREVVGQLLSNAVKHAPEGSSIELAVRAGPTARITVSDRGPGVPEEARERIFQRFERLEKGPITGVGLGLAIVRRVAALHGGRAWVEENPGGGARFVVELPP